MWRLSIAFAEIAVHRRSPADLPASVSLLVLVIVLDYVVALAASQVGTPLPRAATVLLFELALSLGSVWIILRLFGRTRRFVQTATAMIGTEVLLYLVALPLLSWHESLQAPQDQATPPLFLLMLLYFWNVDIGGYIYSEALGRPYVVGVLIMIVYVLTSMQLREAFF